MEEKQPELSDHEYLGKWGQDLIDRYDGNPEVLGKFHIAHMAICRVRELKDAAQRAHALYALQGIICADMVGKSDAEQRAIAGLPPSDTAQSA